MDVQGQKKTVGLYNYSIFMSDSFHPKDESVVLLGNSDNGQKPLM